MQPELKNYGFSFNELDITVGFIEEAMGYERGQSPEPFPEMIDFALNQCDDLCNIKGSLLVSENFSTDKIGVIIFEGITFNVGKKIARQLRNA